MNRVLLSVGVATVVGAGAILAPTKAQAASIGFADIVLDYSNSGANPAFPTQSYGGFFPGSFPIEVSTDVVLGDDPDPNNISFLSLPENSYVTVGFTDDSVIDGPGDDIFITEVGSADERADIFVSSSLDLNPANFTFLGFATNATTTGFDLSSIGFINPVRAIRIVGLDSFGGSPGFDLANVRIERNSIGPAIPTPALLPGLIGLGLGMWRKRKIATEQ